MSVSRDHYAELRQTHLWLGLWRSAVSRIMAKSGLGLDAGSSAAITVLKRAVELDSESRYQPALVCYQEGIDLLLQVLKGTKDDTKKDNLRKKITGYMDRAENIKKYLDQEKEGREKRSSSWPGRLRRRCVWMLNPSLLGSNGRGVSGVGAGRGLGLERDYVFHYPNISNFSLQFWETK